MAMEDASDLRLLDLLIATAQALCRMVDADACAISRVLGDVLILIAEYAPGETLQLGQGYLVPDYPKTEEVLRLGTAYTTTVDDPGADPAEAGVVRELGFGALLMLRLQVAGDAWGLVELYRRAPRPFSDGEVDRARGLTAETAALIP
jgi:GAF domain-containing protein